MGDVGQFITPPSSVALPTPAVAHLVGITPAADFVALTAAMTSAAPVVAAITVTIKRSSDWNASNLFNEFVVEAADQEPVHHVQIRAPPGGTQQHQVSELDLFFKNIHFLYRWVNSSLLWR